MLVKILESDKKEPVLGDLGPGECFMHTGPHNARACFIVTDFHLDGGRKLCVRLENGDSIHYRPEMAIVPIEVTSEVTVC